MKLYLEDIRQEKEEADMLKRRAEAIGDDKEAAKYRGMSLAYWDILERLKPWRLD